MKKLSRKNLEELAKVMPPLSEIEQRAIIGGGVSGDYFDRCGNYLVSDGIDDGKIYLESGGGQVCYMGRQFSEVGGLIVQNRFAAGGKGKNAYTVSTFRTVRSVNRNDPSDILRPTPSGYMLEPGGESTTTPNQDLRIPGGVYDLSSNPGTEYPGYPLLSNGQVPAGRGILFHEGNTSKDTEGCILPGTSYNGNGYVSNSGDKLKEINAFIKQSGGLGRVKVIINEIPDNTQ